MISKLFSGAFLKSSNAAFPFSALVTTAPASVSIYSAISRFSVLSSAKRIFTPERLANFFCCAATFGFSNGSSSVKVEPLCSWLSAVMVPPMRSTKPFTIAIPKPLPWYFVRALSFSCVKGSNSCVSMNSCDIPSPVSLILIWKTTCVSVSRRSVIWVATKPPACV